MPAVSVKQAEMMGADYERAKRGLPTRTGMNLKQLREFASTPRKGLPYRSRSGKERRRQAVAALRAGGK